METGVPGRREEAGKAMDTANGEAGGTPAGPLSHLPWQQIPRFTPGVTSIDEYVKSRLEFIRSLWPDEHVSLLAPRAALQIEGSAFQKISRIDPRKLKNQKV